MDVAAVRKAVGGRASVGAASCRLFVKKDERTPSPVAARFCKSDTKLQIVWAEVLVPYAPDTQGDVISPEEIRKAAYRFAESLRLNQIDVQHDNEVVPGASVVESFIVRKGDPDFIEDSWVVGVYVPDPRLWARIEKGELNSFSIDAVGYEIPKEIELYLPMEIEGRTSEAVDHTHTFKVKFDEEGRFVGGETSFDAGHSHKIAVGTVTEPSEGHKHRFSIVEKLKDAAQSEDQGQ